MRVRAEVRRTKGIRVLFPLSLAILAGSGTGASSAAAVRTAGVRTPERVAAYGALPLRFEPNVGQAGVNVRYLAHGPGFALALGEREAVLSVRGAGRPVHFRLIGATAASRTTPEARAAGKVHYYRGADPQRWRTNVPTYGRVRSHDVYPGIDVVYYGNERRLEYDFVVAPGADPSRVLLEIDGARERRLTADGDLLLTVGQATIRQPRPTLYQEIDGARRTVDGGFVLKGRRVAFRVGEYDRTRPLVIDPVIELAYSSYFGGSEIENFYGAGIAVDAQGSAYIGGETSSIDLATDGWDTSHNGSTDMFIAKITPAGDAVEWATYLGGPQGEELHDLAIDPVGQVYVAGFVHWPGGFPVLNAFQPVIRGGLGDAVVAKFNADGTLFYSSYLGGLGSGIDRSFERPMGVAADAQGHLYVTGYTSSTVNFPIVGGVQSTNKGGSDVFVTKVAPDGQSLVYSTYFGGTGTDSGADIVVDAEGAAYVTGQTTSVDNPTTPAYEGFPVVNALQPTFGGLSDGFVFKLNPAGDQVVFSTYFGGNHFENDGHLGGVSTGGSIALDATGHVYLAGHTRSPDFPTTANRIQGFTGSYDCFVAKLTPSGSSLVYSTYLGGVSVVDLCLDLAVDAQGSAYVAGQSAQGWPLVNQLPPMFNINNNVGFGVDATLAKLSPDGGSLVYSTFLGGTREDRALGVALDARGDAYLTGITYSPSYPLIGAFDTTCTGCANSGPIPGSAEAFVAKIRLVNVAPQAVADTFATPEDVALSVPAPGVLANDTDANGDAVTAVLVSGPAHGTLALQSDGSFVYTPAANFHGADSFTYKAADGTLQSASATVSLTVTPVNDPPSADAGGPYAVGEGETITLAGSGSDVEGDALELAWDLDGDGTFETAGAGVQFVGPPGPATPTVFLRVTDAGGAVGVDSVVVTVENRAPVAADDAAAGVEDTPLVVPAPGVLANDHDVDALTAVLVSPPARGTLVLHADGSFHYQPAPDAHGPDSFTYRASDGLDASAVATVVIDIAAVNDAPVANAGGPYAADEGATIPLVGAGTDVEGGALTYAWDLDGDGVFETPGQAASFTAGGGPSSPVVRLRVTDADGASHEASATVTVRDVAPVAAADAYTTSEDTALVVPAPGVLANDRDFDPLTAILVSVPVRGSLVLEADGAFRYLPAPNAHGSDSFTYQASGGGASSEVVTVALTVLPVNDPPTANAGGPYTVNEGDDVVLAGTGSDVEGGPLTFAWDLDGDGTFETAGDRPTFEAEGGPATEVVRLRVTDADGASATSEAVVTVLNLAPVAAGDAFATPAGTTLTVEEPGVLGNDTDVEPLTAVLVAPPTRGTLTLGADGSLQYVPNAGTTGRDTFTYRASDGTALSDPATVTVDVLPSSEPLQAVDDAFTVARHRLFPHVLNVLANDRLGSAGGTLRVVGVTRPRHGVAIIVNGGRAILYWAQPGFHGTVTFDYTITDGRGGQDTATVRVTVQKRKKEKKHR
jgi:VCBS repeat-containing protein